MIQNLNKTAQNMTVKLRSLSVISNNIANVSTIGFKKDRHFATIVQNAVDKEEAKITGVTIRGPKYEETVLTDFEQGSLLRTGNPLDFAVKGDGFFVLMDKEGNELYTRDGHFTIDADGYLVDMDGNKVQGTGGEIMLDETGISVSQSGEIRLGESIIDQFKIVDFEDRTVLEKEAGNQWKIIDGTDAIPKEPENIEIHQGFLEQSNVNPIEELVRIISLNRGFESSYKVIRQFDHTLGKATNEIGRMS